MATNAQTQVRYEIEPSVSDAALNELFATAWEPYVEHSFMPALEKSLTYVCAFAESQLVGFVNVAWDGDIHAFILDTAVRRSFQRRGVGTRLVRTAAEIATERGMEWLHVDYESHLDGFYRGCGFRSTPAGVVNLKQESRKPR